jgi:hypothetical protein
MPDRPQSIPPSTPPPPPIDLSRTTEATRRQIYDAIVQIHFTLAPGEILAAKRAGEWYQKHTADECGLTVLYLAGRWFAYYRIWEVEDDSPESHHWEILRVEPSLTLPYGVEFYEV